MSIALRLISTRKYVSVMLTGLMIATGLSSAIAQTATVRAGTAATVTGADLLPESTVLYYSCPDVTEAKKRLGNSTSGKLFADEKMQPFLEEVAALIDEKVGDNIKEALDITLEDLAALPTGEVTLAVSGVGREVAVVLLVDFGTNKETLDKILAKMSGALTDNGAEHAEEAAGDVKLQVFTLPPNPAFKKLAYFVQGSRFVFTTDAGLTKTMAGRLTTPAGKTFAKSEPYAAISKDCRTDGRPGVLEFYYDPVGLFKSLVNKVPQLGLVTGYIPVIGLDQFRGIGGSVDCDCDKYEMISKQLLFNDLPLDKIARVFHLAESDQTPPDWVAADTAGYYSLKWDLKGATDAIEELVDSFAGPGGFQKFMEQAADEGDGPGVHPKKDVIDLLDGRVIVTTFNKGKDDEETLSFLVSVPLKDGKAMAKTIARLSKSSDSIKSSEHNGKTIYTLGEPVNEVEISFAIAGENLVISSDSTAIEKQLDGKLPEQKLSDSATYKSLIAAIPKKLNMLGLDIDGGAARMSWNAIRSGSYDPNDTLEFDWEKLPTYDEVKSYFKSSITFTVPSEHGCLTTAYTPKGSK